MGRNRQSRGAGESQEVLQPAEHHRRCTVASLHVLASLANKYRFIILTVLSTVQLPNGH